MFTGLIEQTGRLVRTDPRSGGVKLTVAHDPWPDSLTSGESVAVQGVCLTVTAYASGSFTCDALAETLARSNLGLLRPGAPLNLERAMRAGDRLGGHIVSGHIDGMGRLDGIRTVGADHVLRIQCPRSLSLGIVLKGSIAVDGVSLTVTALDAEGFETHVIPHTWRHTTLEGRGPGDNVNLETDMFGKYVKRYLEASLGSGPLSRADLERAGFA